MNVIGDVDLQLVSHKVQQSSLSFCTLLFPIFLFLILFVLFLLHVSISSFHFQYFFFLLFVSFTLHVLLSYPFVIHLSHFYVPHLLFLISVFNVEKLIVMSLVVALCSVARAVANELQGQWFDPVPHVDVTVDKTLKPCCVIYRVNKGGHYNFFMSHSQLCSALYD